MTPSSIGDRIVTRQQRGRPRNPGSIPGTVNTYLLPELPDRLWGPSSLLSSRYRGLVPRTNIEGAVKSTTHLHLLLRLRISGAIFHSPIWLHGVHTNNSLCFKWTYTVGFTSRSKRPMREIHSLPSKSEVCMWYFTSEHTRYPNHHLMSWRLGRDKFIFLAYTATCTLQAFSPTQSLRCYICISWYIHLPEQSLTEFMSHSGSSKETNKIWPTRC